MGPGFPRGFVPLSDGIGVDLFTPLVREPFFFPSSNKDTSCVGAGVEFASELFSCDATGFSLGGSSWNVGAGEGDDATEGVSFFGMNFLSKDEGTFSMMTFVCFFADLSVRPFATGVDGILTISVVGTL